MFLKRAQHKSGERRGEVRQAVKEILDQIQEQGDVAIRRYSKQFDRWEPVRFRVTEDEIAKAKATLPSTFIEDTLFCQSQVRNFAKAQLETLHSLEIEPHPGIILGHKHIPVASVGAYVPGGRYPLVASAHMSIIPAKAAGVKRVIACSPPNHSQGMYPATLFALHAAGADEIYCLGGVQALAAMAYGSSEIAPVDMLVGAGNAYVAEAKKQLYGQVGIDLLAGPTEILIIADESADPALVAADLLGQSEHDPNSQAVLITTSETLGREVLSEVERQLATLPTAAVAASSWQQHGEVAVVRSKEEAAELADRYAPEHLEVQTRNNDWFLERLQNYGSLFLGEEVTVAYADKVLGPNHILPTGRAARYTGGLWVGKFLKTVTYQRLSRDASHMIGQVAARQCRVEGMLAHEITARLRIARYHAG